MDRLEVNDNAYDKGFLNKKFANSVLKRLQRPVEIKLPAGKGSAKVLESDENIIHDFTLADFGAGTAAVTQSRHPWECYVLDPVDTSVTSFQVKVNPLSYIWGLSGGEWPAASGLRLSQWDREAFKMPAGTPNPYLFTSETQVLYISATFDKDDYSFLSAVVVHGGLWADYPNYYEIVGGEYRVKHLLCWLTDPEEGEDYDVILNNLPYALRNTTHTNLIAGIMRGINTANGASQDIADFPALMPWFSTRFTGS